MLSLLYGMYLIICLIYLFMLSNFSQCIQSNNVTGIWYWFKWVELCSINQPFLLYFAFLLHCVYYKMSWSTSLLKLNFPKSTYLQWDKCTRKNSSKAQLHQLSFIFILLTFLFNLCSRFSVTLILISLHSI